mmetsp:Transcript_41459/g.100180  ORF Transcript_41459/g.100180 Transcript_41459/m.100180 type:complete len:94 (+) Transcript_41459:186-467(+)
MRTEKRRVRLYTIDQAKASNSQVFLAKNRQQQQGQAVGRKISRLHTMVGRGRRLRGDQRLFLNVRQPLVVEQQSARTAGLAKNTEAQRSRLRH